MNGEIVTSLYDKRDVIPVKIVNFPDLSGNIPQDESYRVFIAQTLQYAKACAKYIDFITRTSMLKTNLIKQDFLAKILDRKLDKWHTRSDKAVVMAKFGHDINRVISDLTVITTHMEQNKIQKTKTPKTKNQKPKYKINQ